MPSLDYTDSEWASKESGIMTVRYRTTSKGTNRKITENFSHNNASSNEQIQQRAVLTPDEIGRPSDRQATFFLPETPVFQGHLTPYYKIPTMLKAIDKYSKEDQEVKLRDKPIEYEEELPEPINYPNRIGWDLEALTGWSIVSDVSEPEIMKWKVNEQKQIESLNPEESVDRNGNH